MRITGARLQGSDLILSLSNPAEAAREVFKFKPGEYEIRKAKRKRSLDANAYSWALIHQIASKIHEPPVEVYRGYIRDIGSKVSVSCVQKEDMELEIQTFLDGHIGRMVDIGDSKIPGCVTLHKKYGSSSYSVQEMAAFIDHIVQDCMALDIETRDPADIESLLQQWGESDG